MDSKEIFSRFVTIFTQDDCERLQVHERDQYSLVTVDLHWLRCAEAERFLRNIINLTFRTNFKLLIIHGYHHGTALKDMIWDEDPKCISGRIIKREHVERNEGATMLTIAA